MRVRFSSLVALSMFFCLSAEAASQLDPGTRQQLVALEQKYFGHTFPADDDESRAQRLEKMIFGDAMAGDPGKRIQNLAATTSSGATYENENDKSTANNAQPADDPSTGAGEQYPHITELEHSIIGHTFPGQPLSERLGRMETKAFGAASTNPDFSDRTDALDAFVSQNPKKLERPASAVLTKTDNSDEEAGAISSSYPRITALEAAILGESFAGQTLTARLTRMETKAFGQPNETQDLSDRTDALSNYAETKLHKHIREGGDYSTTPSESGRRQGQGPRVATGIGKQVAAMAANSLLGMVGVPGIGLGAIGAMSGMAAGSRPQQAHPKSDTTSDPKLDDPSVLAPTPPAPESRMIIKVGWCEQQVFGHTFSGMHLTERLDQLNGELRFDPSKRGSQLMDQMNDLIKVVQSRQLPASTAVK